MKIYGKCKNCETEIGYSTSTNTRVEFAIQEGEKKTLSCKKCGTKTEFNVDNLFTKESKMAKIIAGIIFLIGTPFVLYIIYPIISKSRNNYTIYIFSGLLLIPVIVYGIIKKQERTRINSFNRIKLKGRIQNKG